MRAILVAVLAGLTVSAGPVTPDYPITAVPLTDVRITDHFWAPKIEINRTVTIPHIMRQNEATGRVDNFLKAAHAIPGQYKGHRYDDTDVYKVIEAASYSLAAHPDPELDRKVDELIAMVANAQEPDGYLYSARTADPAHPAPGAGPERWSWLSTSHELYNQGHLYEAAVAHFQATGKRTLLNVAIRSADLVCRVFGPNGRRDAPGHEEVELALVKLYRVTGDRKYLDEAKFFLDQRGRPHTDPPHQFAPGDPFDIYNSLAYRQDDRPLVDQAKAEGHAVRATYLYNAMTDVATLDDQPAFGAAVDRLWTDVVSKRIYLTGGLGSVGRTEAFGDDYVLPNRAYAETCASVGGLLWYQRMFLREGDGKYYDTFERTLYNGYLSGVSLAGDSFFYQNPLVSDGRAERSKYFDVACCPANLARLMGELPGLIYAQRRREVYVNLFIGSDATFETAGTRLHVTQTTDYPWQGRVTLHVDPDKPTRFALAVRVPGWARGDAMPSQLYRFAKADDHDQVSLSVNGTRVAVAPVKGYARVDREWQAGDVVELDLPMPVRRVVANDKVSEDAGKAAIQRGPVVYCLEGADNGGHVLQTVLPLDERLTAAFRPELLGGVDVVTGTTITAVPYYAWNNRGKGEMAVWIPYEKTAPPPQSRPVVRGPAHGALVIVGGGKVGRDILGRFFALAGGKDAPLVVIPTAGGEKDYPQDWSGLKMFKAFGATHITVLHTTDRGVADSEAFVKPLLTARAVWFPGGRQWHLVDSYLHTRTERAVENVLDRGGVVGGSSAGASILASYLVRGAPQGNTIMMAPGYEEGFGFLKGAAVDQHMLTRNRQDDLEQVVAAHPDVLGIGLDESTAIVVQGQTFEVIGASKIAVHDGRSAPERNGKKYFFMGPGEKYDLTKLERIAPPRPPDGAIDARDPRALSARR